MPFFNIENWIPAIITASATLCGVIFGGALTFFTQSLIYKRQRQERQADRIREAYATWSGAILREVDALRRQLIFQVQVRSSYTSESQIPEPIRMHWIESAKEMSVQATDATHGENIAFARVVLVDHDAKRLKEAHDIRMPIKESVTDETADVRRVLEELESTEQRFANQLSDFLGRVGRSLC